MQVCAAWLRGACCRDPRTAEACPAGRGTCECPLFRLGRAAWRGWSWGWGVEVVALVEIVDQPEMGRLPRQQLAGQCARRRAVEPEEPGQPREMLARVLGGDGDHGDVEGPSDHLGDAADRDPLTLARPQRKGPRGR